MKKLLKNGTFLLLVAVVAMSATYSVNVFYSGGKTIKNFIGKTLDKNVVTNFPACYKDSVEYDDTVAVTLGFAKNIVYMDSTKGNGVLQFTTTGTLYDGAQVYLIAGYDGSNDTLYVDENGTRRDTFVVNGLQIKRQYVFANGRLYKL